MKYLNEYKLFNLDNLELEDFLIDFKQMGLDLNISSNSSYIIDWYKVNKEISKKYGGFGGTYNNMPYLNSLEFEEDCKNKTGNYYSGIKKSLNIDLIKDDQVFYNIDEFEESYKMISNYLSDVYNMKSDSIIIDYNPLYKHKYYFQNLESIRVWIYGGNYLGRNFCANPVGNGDEFKKINGFKAYKVTFKFV